MWEKGRKGREHLQILLIPFHSLVFFLFVSWENMSKEKNKNWSNGILNISLLGEGRLSNFGKQ